jgi:hypothetical protein
MGEYDMTNISSTKLQEMLKGNGNKFGINEKGGRQLADQKQRGHRNKGIQTQFSNQEVVGETTAIQDQSRYKTEERLTARREQEVQRSRNNSNSVEFMGSKGRELKSSREMSIMIHKTN